MRVRFIHFGHLPLWDVCGREHESTAYIAQRCAHLAVRQAAHRLIYSVAGFLIITGRRFFFHWFKE